MSLLNWFDSMPNTCVPTEGYTSLDWSVKGRGFGQLYFFVEDGKLYCNNECLSKERVKEILCMMVDNSIFDEDIPFDEESDDAINNQETQ